MSQAAGRSRTGTTLLLPTASAAGMTESGRPLAQVAEVKLADLDRGRVRIEVPAGSYEFSAPQ